MTLRALFYNTFLLRAGRLPIPGRKRYLHSVPAVEARADELGRRLSGRYDVAALCEVFDPTERAAVLAGWRERDRNRDRTGSPGGRARSGPRSAVGPPMSSRRVPLVKPSGLLTVVDGPQMTRTATHLYRTRGHRFLDADAWARKGALLVEVDVGASANLEIYSTHLLWGGDLLVRRDRGHRSRVADFRQAQSHELLDFVRRTHVEGNATLIVGDFNVDALHPEPAYADLTAAMADAGFADAWLEHGDGAGFTCDVRLLGDAIAVPDPATQDLCRDDLDPPPGAEAGKRIDFAWLRRPTTVDRVTTQVRSIRRACFPREAGVDGYDELPYLSDHLGLHLELDLT